MYQSGTTSYKARSSMHKLIFISLLVVSLAMVARCADVYSPLGTYEGKDYWVGETQYARGRTIEKCQGKFGPAAYSCKIENEGEWKYLQSQLSAKQQCKGCTHNFWINYKYDIAPTKKDQGVLITVTDSTVGQKIENNINHRKYICQVPAKPTPPTPTPPTPTPPTPTPPTPTPPTPTPTPPQKYQWECGQEINKGSICTVANGRLEFQSDGNVVVYTSNNGIQWQSNTGGGRGNRCKFENDGNLVVYDSKSDVLWQSSTQNRGGNLLVFKGDGNLVIINSKNEPLWQSCGC